MTLNNTFTSTGSKFFAHQEAMTKLRNGQGQPIVSHVMLTDVCQHTCAFCSVQHRAGDSLDAEVVVKYLDILKGYGLKAVILSGGGNPILYKCKKTGADFDIIIDTIKRMGLEIGVITNGMRMRKYGDQRYLDKIRQSWATVGPDTLDKLTWVRISMSGLDHKENEVYVPDIDPDKTTLGFSYVAHDIYKEPADPHHGKVSTQLDLVSGDKQRTPDLSFESRLENLIDQIGYYVKTYNPRYVRLLPNCLEPSQIEERCLVLSGMAYHINNVYAGGREVAFVQNKPPKAPHACYLGYVHPVLNCDGYVYPCDSCVLNETAGHAFSNPWRICRWDEIGQLYEKPVRSLIADPAKTCPGCVFPESNRILESVVEGRADLSLPMVEHEHVNFV